VFLRGHLYAPPAADIGMGVRDLTRATTTTMVGVASPAHGQIMDGFVLNSAGVSPPRRPPFDIGSARGATFRIWHCISMTACDSHTKLAEFFQPDRGAGL
jgi:hypothetical protein